MPEEPTSSDTRSDLPAKKAGRKRVVIAACVICLAAIVGLASGFAGSLLGTAWISQDDGALAVSRDNDVADDGAQAEPGTEGGEEAAAEAQGGEGEAEHTHDWSAVYALRDVPAVTHVEHHDAVYGTETSYETVCNECDAIVTGATREHTEETGHTGFTTNVPIENEVVEQEAYDETVVDAPATVQLVHTSDQCSSCGEVRDVEDEVVQTMDGLASQE